MIGEYSTEPPSDPTVNYTATDPLGADGSTGLETIDQVGLAVVKALIDGKSLDRARAAGQNVYDKNEDVVCGGDGAVPTKCNKGDKVKVVRLPPKDDDSDEEKE
ncbi:MAG: hypothetical protein LC113_07160 [Acidobacteria bacterium]|nr:hypothetical protein [Acidobacteriota bacterium]